MLCPGAQGPQGTMEWHRRSSQWLTGTARWIWSETPVWEGCARGKSKTSMKKKILVAPLYTFSYQKSEIIPLDMRWCSPNIKSLSVSVGLIAKCTGVKKWVSRFLFSKGQSFKDHGEIEAISTLFIYQARKRKLFLICQIFKVECSVSESHNFYSIFPSTLHSGLLFIQKF